MMMPAQQGQPYQGQSQGQNQGQNQWQNLGQNQGQQNQAQSQGFYVTPQPGQNNNRQDPVTVGPQQDSVSPFYASP
jgi:hypothetical protein